MTQLKINPARDDILIRLESVFAKRLTDVLQVSIYEIPNHIEERLRIGREIAVVRRQIASKEHISSLVEASGKLNLILHNVSMGWHRLASLLPLVALVAGFFVIQQHLESEQISTFAEVDAALLADELPPAAYRDPGFMAFLRFQNMK